MTVPTPPAPAPAPAPYSTTPPDWLTRFYTEGSATCRNYSTLTMHVRTVASVVFAGGSGVLLYKEFSFKADPGVSLCAGLFMCTLAIMLALTGWHYQTAFEAIRNELDDMERVIPGSNGIWGAHKRMRDGQPDLLSSYGPYMILGTAGLLAAGYGVYGLRFAPWCVAAFVIALVSMLLVALVIVRFRRKASRTLAL